MKYAYYFKHDVNARHDPKIQILIKDYGLEGYGRFWVIIEMLRETSTYKLECRPYVWSALSLEFRASVENVKQFIHDCVEKYELFVQNDGFFYSPSLLKRMIELDNLREKRKMAADIRWGNE